MVMRSVASVCASVVLGLQLLDTLAYKFHFCLSFCIHPNFSVNDEAQNTQTTVVDRTERSRILGFVLMPWLHVK